MKNTIIALFFSIIFFACKEAGSISTVNEFNKHNSERTLADLIITTPTVLSANATYGLIEIKNGGSLTITNNSTITCTEFKSTVNHIYATSINIEQGSTLDVTGVPVIYVNSITTFNVWGTLKQFSYMDVYGYVNIFSTGKHISNSDIQVFQGVYTINSGEVILDSPTGNPEFSIESSSASLKFEHCGRLITERFVVALGANNKVSGIGRIKTVDSILNDVLTSSNKIIYCAQNYYYPYGGSTGAANVNCLKVCFEI